MSEISIKRTCHNCINKSVKYSEEPCRSCRCYSNWDFITPENSTTAPAATIVPTHYPAAGTAGDVIAAALRWNLGFCEGNIIKYLVRWKRKGGLEDLKKARTYLERLIDRAEADQAKVEAN